MKIKQIQSLLQKKSATEEPVTNIVSEYEAMYYPDLLQEAGMTEEDFGEEGWQISPDPDILLCDGEKYYFEKIGGYVIFLGEDGTDEMPPKAKQMITEFFSDSWKNSFTERESNWDVFYSLENAIAYRGGQGYFYGIHEYTPAGESENNEMINNSKRIQNILKKSNVGGFDYKTVDISTERGLQEAERLKNNGWSIINTGFNTVQFEKKRKPNIVNIPDDVVDVTERDRKFLEDNGFRPKSKKIQNILKQSYDYPFNSKNPAKWGDNYSTPLVINENGNFKFDTGKYSPTTSTIQTKIKSIAQQLGIQLNSMEGGNRGMDAISKIQNILKKSEEVVPEQNSQTNNVKTIDVHALEWRDKINGNSYFSGTVIVNYKMPDEQEFKMPFQYGYGDQYLQEAEAVLAQNGIIQLEKYSTLWRYCDENNIILRYNKQTNMKKRDLMQFSRKKISGWGVLDTEHNIDWNDVNYVEDEDGNRYSLYDIGVSWASIIPEGKGVYDNRKIPIGDLYEFYTPVKENVKKKNKIQKISGWGVKDMEHNINWNDVNYVEDEDGNVYSLYNLGVSWAVIIPKGKDVSDKIKIPIGDLYEFYTPVKENVKKKNKIQKIQNILKQSDRKGDSNNPSHMEVYRKGQIMEIQEWLDEHSDYGPWTEGVLMDYGIHTDSDLFDMGSDSLRQLLSDLKDVYFQENDGVNNQ